MTIYIDNEFNDNEAYVEIEEKSNNKARTYPLNIPMESILVGHGAISCST